MTGHCLCAGADPGQIPFNQQAIDLALQYRIAIQYDQTAQSPYFHYTAEDGIIHEVWFEDARSPFRQAPPYCRIRLSRQRYLESHAPVFSDMAACRQSVRHRLASVFHSVSHCHRPERQTFRGIFLFSRSILTK